MALFSASARSWFAAGVTPALAMASGCSTDDPSRDITERATTESRTGTSQQAATPSGMPVDEAFEVFSDGTTTTGRVAAPPTRYAQSPPGVFLGQKPPGPAITPVPQQNGRQRILAEVSQTSDADALIRVNMIFDELPTDWAAFRRLKARGETATFVEQRTAAVAQSHAGTVAWLKSIGAENIESSWLVNQLRADVPAKHVAGLLNRPEIKSVEPNKKRERVPDRLWAGGEVQNAVRTTGMYAAGVAGHGGSRSGGRIKIAVIEPQGVGGNWPVSGHPGWQRPGLTGSRLKVVKDCSIVGCPDTSATSNDSHGAHMTHLAGMSIEANQDPNYQYFRLLKRVGVDL